MSIKLNFSNLNEYKIPGGPYADMSWTTPLVTFKSTYGTKFIVQIIAQIPNGLTPKIKGPTISKESFDTGLGKGKLLHIITVEIPYRTHYEAPNLYFFTIEYEIKDSEVDNNHGVYVNYKSIDDGNRSRPFPDPELERGTVTTSGIPNP